MAKLKITLKRSPIGYEESQKRTVRALGLRKLHQSVIHEDTPTLRGMIAKVVHLVQVEPVDGAQESEPPKPSSQATAGSSSAEGTPAEPTQHESQEVSS